MTTEVVTHTERSCLNALRTRHAPKRGGNGPEWAYVEHVRSAAGFAAERTLDAMGLGLWPSRGMELHGYEVKISRADFRRELADPAKMEAFAPYLDRFWIVAPNGIVPVAELPASWGLLEVNDAGVIRQKVAAPLLSTTRVAIPRNFLVPLMRAAGAGLSHTPEETAIADAELKGYERGVESAKRSANEFEKLYLAAREERDVDRTILRELDSALGVPNHTHVPHEMRLERARVVAEAVKAAVAGDEAIKRGRNQIRYALDELGRVGKQISNVSDWITKETGVTREDKQ